MDLNKTAFFQTPATEGFPEHLHFWPTGYKPGGFPWPPQIQEFTKMALRTQESTLFMITVFLNKGYKSGKATWRDTCGEAWEVLDVELLCPLRVESGCIILLVHRSVNQSGGSTELLCPDVFWKFHHTGMTDWTWIIWLNVLSSPLLYVEVGLAQSLDPLITWLAFLVTSPILNPFISLHKPRWDPRRLWITDIPLPWKILRS